MFTIPLSIIVTIVGDTVVENSHFRVSYNGRLLQGTPLYNLNCIKGVLPMPNPDTSG